MSTPTVVQPLSNAQLRARIQHILRAHGFQNRFTIRKISFEGLGYGSGRFVTIYDWTPHPLSSALKETIRNHTRALVQFRAPSASRRDGTIPPHRPESSS